MRCSANRAVLALAACASPPSTVPHGGLAPASPSLAIEQHRPGRLILERDGTAWSVRCADHVLTKQRWEGGPLEPAGLCGLDDDAEPGIATEAFIPDVVAISGETVARWTKETGIRITVNGVETRAIAVANLWVMGLAIDGDAIVVAVHRYGASGPEGFAVGGAQLPTELAALVRIEPAHVITRELERYLGTAPGMDPRFVATGPERMVLANKTGGVVTCDYHLTCAPQLLIAEVGGADGAIPLADGGLLLYRHDRSLARITPRGKLAWSVDISVFGLVGATSREVWITARGRLGEPLQIRGIDLGSGSDLGERGALFRAPRETRGRYLTIAGVAATKLGPVVRGVFGGRLDGGAGQVLTTENHGAVCWWETAHDGSEHPIALDGTCTHPFRKAILTDRVPFVAINAAALVQ